MAKLLHKVEKQTLPLATIAWLMDTLPNAYAIGVPLNAVLYEAGIEFNELFRNNHIAFHLDFTKEGIQQILIHNYDNDVLIIRPNGIVKIVFEYRLVIIKYRGQGQLEVHGAPKNEVQVITLDPHTLEVRFTPA